MTDVPSRTAEIDAYLVAVERHLADLPEAIREDLMSDLDAHLAEVAADLDAGTALRDLLGSPEAYARELRETAEVPRERAGDRLRRGLRQTAEPLTRRLKDWADKYAVSTGHADAAELRDRLRPGWWALRGALVALVFLYLFAAAQFNATGYNLLGSIPGTLLAIALVLLCVWASLRIGKKSLEWGRRRRLWTGAAGVALVAYSFYAFGWSLSGVVPIGSVENASDDYYYDDPASYLSDIYVYDENGEPLTGVYLFDQNGDPIMIGDPWNCEPAMDPFATAEEHRSQGAPEGDASGAFDDLGYYQYPLCADQAPDTTAGPSATPSESATATPGETATPAEDSTATPETTATPSATPEETATS
ncbi:apolipoprotein A1/A4/E family protein [Glycomyces sp. A-F 0318]|uniref:apolipoprotein A1/A4/E family protein n=1 Tax=Glycomyces amatae TaxID=2881355 RepID=UPI001E65102F|nr:apolipoprotein A1/A4/E family protein [Glycomyces amatae]MCD0445216.1 apolipoprotein A1/A4/E family protein [Glycomyces amatae]